MGCGCNKKKTDNKEVIIDPQKGFVSVEKKEQPSLLTKALNLGETLTNHIADGMSKCTDKELSVRLDICHKCPEREGKTCTKCGCLLSVKSGWRTADCPMDKWPKLNK